MPYYTGLARVARRTGYPVFEVTGWEKRGHGPMAGVKTIKFHHTAGGANGNYPSMGTVLNGRPGLPGPLAQFGVGRDGTIYVFAAGLTYHAGASRTAEEGNSYSIGIEAEHTGRKGDPWPAVQLDSVVKLTRELLDEFKLPVSKAQGHKETAVPLGRKPDPVDINMDDYRSWVKRGYYIMPGLTPTSDKTKPTPTTTPVSIQKDELEMASINEVKQALVDAFKAVRVPVKRGGESTTKDLLTVVSGLDGNVISQGAQQVKQAGQIAALENAVELIATKVDITAEEFQTAIAAGAARGTREALKEAFVVEGIASVELKVAE